MNRVGAPNPSFALFAKEGGDFDLFHDALTRESPYYAAAILRIKSSCSALLSVPIVNASSTPELSANLIPSS